MNGKMNNSNVTFCDLFNAQALFQNAIIEKGLYDKFKDEKTTSVPVDDVRLTSYHVQQLMSEIGEVLNADKRWKSHRNERYEEQEKLEEIADCFIVLMNVAMFSGFDGDDLVKTITMKIGKNVKRIN